MNVDNYQTVRCHVHTTENFTEIIYTSANLIGLKDDISTSTLIKAYSIIGQRTEA